MATTGWPASLIMIGISPPRPKWSNSVTPAASVVATPASTALPPSARMRMPASTSKLLHDPTISCRPRTGGNMVSFDWAARVAGSKNAKAALRAAAGKITRRAESGFIAEQRPRNRHAAYVDFAEVRRAYTMPLGEEQRILTGPKWGEAPRCTRIVAHNRGRYGIGRNRIQSSQQYAGLYAVYALDPGTFTARDRFDAIDDLQVDGARLHQVGDDVRHAVSRLAAGRRVQLRWRRL